MVALGVDRGWQRSTIDSAVRGELARAMTSGGSSAISRNASQPSADAQTAAARTPSFASSSSRAVEGQGGDEDARP